MAPTRQAPPSPIHFWVLFNPTQSCSFLVGGSFAGPNSQTYPILFPKVYSMKDPKHLLRRKLMTKNAPSLFATKILYVFYKCWCELSLGLLFTLYVVAQSSYFCKIIKIFSRMEVLLEMQWTAFGWKLFSREIWKITKYIILIYTWSICIVLPNIVKICKTFLMWLWCVMIVTCQVIPCPHFAILNVCGFFFSQKSEMAAKIWSFCDW